MGSGCDGWSPGGEVHWGVIWQHPLLLPEWLPFPG